MNRRSQHPRRAFTLLELVLVLIILCVALAVTAPSLSGWNRGSKSRDAGEQFLALTRWARTQALANAQVFRLNVDSRSNTYFLTAQDGRQFVRLSSEFGRVFTLPEGFRIAMIDAQAQPLESVDFFPTGRTQPARVRIARDGDNYAVDIECPSPAEGFRLASQPQEAAR